MDLSDDHNRSGFQCTNREITDWVRRKAHIEHRPGLMNVTCAIPEGGKRPIGIYALSTVAEEVSNLPGWQYRPFRSGKHFPAMHLVWLATDIGFIDRGLGKVMVGQVIRIFAEIGARVGIPHLVLTPAVEDKEKLAKFYGDLGFQPYKDEESMYLHIEDAIDAVEKAKAAQREASQQGA